MYRVIKIYRGLPGSGKSTKARADMRAMGMSSDFIAEMDSYPNRYIQTLEGLAFNPAVNQNDVGQWCESIVRGWMISLISPIAVANTFVKIRYMEPYLNMAIQYGYQVQVIDCRGEFESLHNPPAEVMKRMKANWEDYN